MQKGVEAFTQEELDHIKSVEEMLGGKLTNFQKVMLIDTKRANTGRDGRAKFNLKSKKES